MSTADSPGYHHGNLRAVLLKAAAAQIEAVGAARLSLRELARQAGVSHAAPAHHFTDKRGLFTALATEAFRLLHERTAPQLAQPSPLLGTGKRYVEFALEHPAHFVVMFDTSLLDEEDPSLQQERAVAFDVLYRAVYASTGVVDEADMLAQALAAWAVVHGVATLWLAGNLPYERDAALVERAFRDLGPALLPVAEATAGTPAPAEESPPEEC